MSETAEYVRLKAGIQSLKNNQLKEILKRAKEKVGGNKTELLNRINIMLEQKSRLGLLSEVSRWYNEVTNPSDDDVISTSELVSLKDPVTKTYITTPARGSKCLHVQCFDLESFLLLNETHPTWTCPTCSNIVAFKDIFVDGYFEELLRSAASDKRGVETVEIQTDGTWTLQAPPEAESCEDSSDSDDESRNPNKSTAGVSN
ncbi:SUMO ligase siz1, partial [Chytridiales sp. JEL 0842]